MNLSFVSYHTLFTMFILSTFSMRLYGQNMFAQESYETVWQRSKKVMLAGGRLECMQLAFEGIPGIIRIRGGHRDRDKAFGSNKISPENRNLKIKAGLLQEAIVISYDPRQITLSRILNRFWRSIDPTDAEGQFADRGPRYATTIFYSDESEKRIAEKSKRIVEMSFAEPIATSIEAARFHYLYSPEWVDSDAHKVFSDFTPLDDDYTKKSPQKIGRYCENSGRTAALEELWHSKRRPHPVYSTQELKARLTPEQYRVTQEKELEQPYANDYWKKKKEERGIYVDIVTGEPLFSSRDKLKSKNGWPRFRIPVEDPYTGDGTPWSFDLNVVMRGSFEQGINGPQQVEVRSRFGNSHLGYFRHVFPFGHNSWFLVNSAALRFIAEEDLDKEGYGEYRKLL